jgi:Flp pilus assembly protein TadG
MRLSRASASTSQSSSHMYLRTITSRLRTENGQAAVEFALVVPLLITFLFILVGFGRAFNAYNDLNQMAADGARFAAVGNFPGTTALLDNADTPLSKSAVIAGPTYQAPGSSTWGSTCVVGGTVKVTATANLHLIPFLPYINSSLPGVPTLTGSAEMRVERCPS